MVLGIDIGGTRTKIGLVDEKSLMIYDFKVFKTNKYDKEQFFENIGKTIAELCENAQINREEIVGAGIGIGSYIYREGGLVDDTGGYIPCLEGIKLEEEITDRFGLSSIVDNDLRAIALAESRLGAGKDICRVLTVTLGTGVGVCLTENGKFVEREAVTHLAGHIKVRGKDEWIEAVDRDGCYCAVFGCLENTCSATALEKIAKQSVDEMIDNRELFQRALQGDKKANICLEAFFEYLVRGLNQMVYIFSPDVIVLGGGITKAFEPYLSEMQRKLTAKVHSRQTTEIRISKLEERSGIVGAALLWLENRAHENKRP